MSGPIFFLLLIVNTITESKYEIKKAYLQKETIRIQASAFYSIFVKNVVRHNFFA